LNNCCAIAKPMPFEPPKTTAIFSLSSSSILISDQV
jgi:hypothetical protein